MASHLVTSVGHALLGNTVAGVALIAIGASIALFYGLYTHKTKSVAARSRRFFQSPTRIGKRAVHAPRNRGAPLKAVMAASFQRRPVFNASEYHAFKIIEDDIAAEQMGYRVFAQTSLGEILASPNDDAFHSINAKRIDILVIDRSGLPVVAVEYQGSGHYQGRAAARDAIKMEALRKAGVRYVEVFPSDSADQIRARVREQLGWKITARPNLEPQASATA